MLTDEKGHVLQLGQQVGRSGGEGNAYIIENLPGFVAKIYNRPPPSDYTLKLQYLAQQNTPALQKCSAWPSSIVRDEQAQTRGFVMPLVSGKEIHQLFGPRDRVVEFPGRNWDFLVNSARNCASAFDVVHSIGAVIGDVNEGNILVKQNSVVALIDCDSYQVTNGSRSWTCNVGVSLWTPPELQRQQFRGLVRTPNHDLFGLAVMIFKLLFLGRHPYAGVSTNGKDPEIDEAIRNRLYAYSREAPQFGLRPPPFAFPVDRLGEPYVTMFERAFRLSLPRPTASEWTAALSSLQKTLISCSRDASHKYPGFIKNCPWCEISAAGGPLYFVSVNVIILPPGQSASSIWASINSIQRLTLIPKTAKDFTLPASVATPLPPGAKGTKPVFIFGVILLLITIFLLSGGLLFPAAITMCFGLGMIFEGYRTPQFKEEKLRRAAIANQLDRDLASLGEQLTSCVATYNSSFDTKMLDLKQAYQRYIGLDSERLAEMQRLEREKRELQLNDFLKAQLISRAEISGIGDGRKRRLMSFGIGSAFDIKPNIRLPGFGPTYMTALLSWRAGWEARFRFEPSRPIPQVEVQRLNLKIASLRQDLWSKLSSGPAGLANLSAGSKGRFLQLQGQLEAMIARRAQAYADYKVC